MTPAAKHGSVQDLLPLEDIVEGVLCLRGGEYRAVIQAQSVNFALKSEEEQEAVMAMARKADFSSVIPYGKRNFMHLAVNR